MPLADLEVIQEPHPLMELVDIIYHQAVLLDQQILVLAAAVAGITQVVMVVLAALEYS